MFKAPAIWFKTTSLMIDDDAFFAQLAIKEFGISDFKCFNNSNLLIKKELYDFILIDENNDINNCNLESLRKNIDIIKAKENLVSLVLSDLHMPEISGWNLFGYLKDVFVTKVLMSNFIKSQLKDLIKTEKQVNIDFFFR